MTHAHPSGPDDPRDPDALDALDELVSAYVDAETTSDETARVEADPALVARAAELGAVAAGVGAPVEPPPPEVRDRQIATALAAAAAGAPHGGMVDLAAARERRERHRRRLWMVSVAAAVLMAVAVVPLLASLGDDGTSTETATFQDQDAAEGAAESAAPTSTSAVPGGDDADAGGGAVVDQPGIPVADRAVDLGSFADQDDLVRAVSQSQAGPAPEAATESTMPLIAADVCLPPPARPEPITGLYTAIMGGGRVTVYVYEADGSRSMLVLDAGCSLILETDL